MQCESLIEHYEQTVHNAFLFIYFNLTFIILICWGTLKLKERDQSKNHEENK
jgi:hypothetical protein